MANRQSAITQGLSLLVLQPLLSIFYSVIRRSKQWQNAFFVPLHLWQFVLCKKSHPTFIHAERASSFCHYCGEIGSLACVILDICSISYFTRTINVCRTNSPPHPNLDLLPHMLCPIIISQGTRNRFLPKLELFAIVQLFIAQLDETLQDFLLALGAEIAYAPESVRKRNKLRNPAEIGRAHV